MDFLSYLGKYEKENVSNTKRIVKENTEKLNAVIKEAFYGDFVSKVEAKLRVTTEFTNKRTAPEGVDVTYVNENMGDIINKIDQLDEGSIKIIINNDVDKGNGKGLGATCGGPSKGVAGIVVPDVEVEEGCGKGKKTKKEKMGESEETKVVIADKETGSIWGGVFKYDDAEKKLKGAQKKNPNYVIMDFDKAENLAKKYKEMDESKEDLDEMKMKPKTKDHYPKEEKEEDKEVVEEEKEELDEKKKSEDDEKKDGIKESKEELKEDDDEDEKPEGEEDETPEGEEEPEFEEPKEDSDITWSDIMNKLDTIEDKVDDLTDMEKEEEAEEEGEIEDLEGIVDPEEEEVLGDEAIVPEETEKAVEEKKEELEETEEEVVEEKKDELATVLDKIKNFDTIAMTDKGEAELKKLYDKAKELKKKAKESVDESKLKEESENYLEYLMGDE